VKAPAPNGAEHHILSLSFTELQLEPVIAAARARGVRVTLAGDAKRFEQFAETAVKADRGWLLICAKATLMSAWRG